MVDFLTKIGHLYIPDDEHPTETEGEKLNIKRLYEKILEDQNSSCARSNTVHLRAKFFPGWKRKNIEKRADRII